MTRTRPAQPVERGAVHTFAGGDLDRAAHLRANPEQVRVMRESADTLYLLFRELDPLVRMDPTPRLGWLTLSDIDAVVETEAQEVFLGFADGSPRFAVELPMTAARGVPGQTGAAFRGVREIAPLLTVPEASTAALGRSLIAWNSTHRYCPGCGSPTEAVEAGHARRCTRERCGITQFPRTDPVVIMLVHRGGQCLLGRAVRARRYPPGLHSCLAGYVEPGESIEEAVRRETWEEAGLRIDRVRYHSSQPWPFPSTLMIGCFGEALPGELCIDPGELESARWFTRQELRLAVERWNEDGALRLPPPLTIAHQLARAWLVEDSGPN